MSDRPHEDYKVPFRIEKGVPLSEFYAAQHKRYMSYQYRDDSKYPFKKMEVGDSFLVPIHLIDKRGKLAAIRKLASSYGKRYNMKFVVMRDDTHRYRCWRME